MGLATISQAQQYQMDVETIDGLITSYLVNDVQDVTYQDEKTVITFGDKTVKTYDNQMIRSISWPENRTNPTANGGTFTLDEDHLSVVTPEYSISFSPTVIEEEMTLTVTKSSATPSLMLDGARVVAAYDFSLGNKHELDGIAEIRLPMKTTPGYTPAAVYYNEAAAEWEAVNGTYDASAGEMVIITRHLSKYACIEIEAANTAKATIKLFFPPVAILKLPELAEKLRKLTDSNDIEAEAIELYGSQYSEVTQLGLDIGFNSLLSLGFGSTMLEEFSEILGDLGVALSVYQICRNDFKGEDVQKAGNTLKLCLQQAISWANYYCGNAILTGSLASVAMLDYSINKFATTAWSSRKDFYRNAMWEYYNQYEGRKHHRKAVDWYKIIKRIMSRKDLTEKQINDLVDKEVCDYCNEWKKGDYLTWYEAEKNVKFGFSGGDITACKDLFDEMRGELYNGVLVSVFQFIKKEMEQEVFDIEDEKMREYVKMLNKEVTLQLVDNRMTNDRSEYAGYTVRFKNLPTGIKDPEKWQCVLDEKGQGQIRYTVIAQYDGGVGTVLELVTPGNNGQVVNEIPLSNLNVGTNTINIAKNNAKVEPTLLEFPAEGGVKFVNYYYGDYKYLTRLTSDAASSWIKSSWSDDDRFKDEVIVGIGPNTTGQARQDTIKMGFSMEKSVAFEKRFIIPIVIRQAAGPYKLADAKSYLVGSWRYKETVSGSYDIVKDYLITFNSDGTYKEDRKEDAINYDYHTTGQEEGTYEVIEITQESTNRMRLKVKMVYNGGANSREATIDIYAHRIFYWQPRLHYYDREK